MPVERLNMLEANASNVEPDYVYQKEYTPEEMEEMKDRLATDVIEVRKIDSEMRKATAGFRARLKEIQNRINTTAQDLKIKSREVSEKCYVLKDIESRELGIYNADGQLVYSRPLKPTEYQRTIEFSKTGTED